MSYCRYTTADESARGTCDGMERWGVNLADDKSTQINERIGWLVQRLAQALICTDPSDVSTEVHRLITILR